MRCITRTHAAQLAHHLQDAGQRVLDFGVETDDGLLAVVLTGDRGEWIFGQLRIADEDDGFTPPVGRYCDDTRYRARMQATAWFRRARVVPTTGRVRFDAYGLLLTPAGHIARVDHVPDAF